MRAAKVTILCAVGSLLIGAVIVALIAISANRWAKLCSDKSFPDYIQDDNVRRGQCF